MRRSPTTRSTMGAFPAIAALVLLAGTAQAQDARKPNFVIILADDLGYGDIGAFGSKLIKTPNLDRMAAEGAVLTSFYSSANICTPSRGGLLTGKYPIRLDLTKGVARPTNKIGLSQDETTVATILRDEGYATACIGKWHLGHAPEHWPTAHGFDYFYGLPYSNDMLPLALYRMGEAIEEPVDQTTLTERYTREALQFIESNRDQPFFLYLPHTMPHVPLHVSEGFARKSDAGLYGDVVETIDWSVGEILSKLEELGLAENTLVLFTSDNGPWWEGSAGEFRDRKGSSWDGGMRVPLIARWPGTIMAGTRSDAISMNIDLFPTLLKLAGAKAPKRKDIDGRDIFSLLEGSTDSPHEYLYLFNGSVIAAVRTQRWKLVSQSFYRGYSITVGAKSYYYHPGMLFDMESSAVETYSSARENPEVTAELGDVLEKGRKELEGRK